MKKRVILNIAGEIVPILFDGESVFEPLFPDHKIVRFRARCGLLITQEMLADICKQKLAQTA